MNCRDHGAIADYERGLREQPQSRRGLPLLSVNMVLLWALFIGLFSPVVITLWIFLFRVIIPGAPQPAPNYQQPYRQQSHTTLTRYK